MESSTHERKDEMNSTATINPARTAPEYFEDVIGSYVVYDPTGRDLPSCMEVGRVAAVTWCSDDNGNADGSPRPILTVQPNGSDDDPDHAVAVTVIHSVIPRRSRS